MSNRVGRTATNKAIAKWVCQNEHERESGIAVAQELGLTADAFYQRARRVRKLIKAGEWSLEAVPVR